MGGTGATEINKAREFAVQCGIETGKPTSLLQGSNCCEGKEGSAGCYDIQGSSKTPSQDLGGKGRILAESDI